MPGPQKEDGSFQVLCTSCGEEYSRKQAETAEREQAEQARVKAETAAAREAAAAADKVRREAAAAKRAEAVAAAKVRLEQAEESRLAADGQQELRSRYRVLSEAVVRTGYMLTSPRATRGVLHVGEVIEAIAEHTLEGGIERVRLSDGWASKHATDGTVILEPGSEWLRVVASTEIRIGLEVGSARPPHLFEQTLNVGDIVKARQVVQDDVDGYEYAEDEVPALHICIGVDRWVSEVASSGDVFLENVGLEARRQMEEDERIAQAAAEKMEQERAKGELLQMQAAAAAKAQAEAQAREEADLRERLAAAKLKQETADATDVGAWLHGLNLGLYAIAFFDEGYEELAVLKLVEESMVDEVMQNVEMKVGHSFRFREGLAVLQMEDATAAAKAAQRELQAAVQDHIAPDIAAIALAEARLTTAIEQSALHQAAHVSAIEKTTTSQQRTDDADVQAYRDTVETQRYTERVAAATAIIQAADAETNRETVQGQRAAVLFATEKNARSSMAARLQLEQTALQAAQQATHAAECRQKLAKATIAHEAAMTRTLETERGDAASRAQHAMLIAQQAIEAKEAAENASKAAGELFSEEEARAAKATALVESQEHLNENSTAQLKVKSIKEGYSNGNEEEEHVRTLVAAAARGDAALALQIVSRGVPIDSFDRDGESALTQASRHEHAHCVELLLSHGADYEQLPMKIWSESMAGRWLERRFRWGKRYLALFASVDGKRLVMLRTVLAVQELGVVVWAHAQLISKCVDNRCLSDESKAYAALVRANEAVAVLEGEVEAKLTEERRDRETKALAEKELEIAQLEARWKHVMVVSEEKTKARLHMDANRSEFASNVPGMRGVHMVVNVRGPDRTIHAIDCWSLETVLQLKTSIGKATGLAPTMQSLIYKFKDLNNIMSLRAAGIADGAVLTVTRVAAGTRNNRILMAMK